MKRPLVIAALFAVSAVPAQAEIVSSSAIHFDIQSRIVVPANPDLTYEMLVNIGAWWSSGHSYSGNAANMRIDAWAGGCFCETYPDGGTAEHLRVIHAVPGQMLRMSGGLGPLQAEAVTGTLTWTLRPVDGGTEITSRYLVSGHVRGDTGAYAAPVDAVIREQFERLRRSFAR